jgi:hypothetical protein
VPDPLLPQLLARRSPNTFEGSMLTVCATACESRGEGDHARVNQNKWLRVGGVSVCGTTLNAGYKGDQQWVKRLNGIARERR